MRISVKPTVLVVEDLDNWLDVFCTLLSADYEIVTSKSYDEAVKVLDTNPASIDLIIADISLKSENRKDEGGLRLLEFVNKHHSSIPTIVVTGYPTFTSIRRALKDLQAYDYVEKHPEAGEFSTTGFLDTVRGAILHIRERDSVTSLDSKNPQEEITQ